MGVKVVDETRDEGRETSVPEASLVPRPLSLVYRAVAHLVTALPVGPRKLRESLAGRRHAVERWAAWNGGRTIWFHAASVGEALSAEPIMRRLRKARPDLPLILTHTSPSVTRWPNPLPVARTDFAPAENPRAMDRAFTALRPALLVFSRTDLWPEMLRAARQRGVAVAVAGGAIGAHSRRLSGPARAFLGPLYRTIQFVGALTEADASRWRTLGVSPDAIVVTGDPRHDQVLERPDRVAAIRSLAAWAADGPTLVAGSVEPEDVAPLRDAFQLVRSQRPDARLIVVPHDPTSPAAEPFRNVQNVMLVTSMGALADLYLLADIAYVGGSFGRRGQHSVLEPAACAVPVLPAAAEGGGAMARQWLAWLNDPRAAQASGLAARRTLVSGASRTITNRLLELIP